MRESGYRSCQKVDRCPESALLETPTAAGPRRRCAPRLATILTAPETAIRQLIAEGLINLGPLSWEGGSFQPTGPVTFHQAPDDGGEPMPMADIARKKAK